MSSSSYEVVQEVQNETIPEWLESFLEKTFFDKCLTHDGMQRNDLNRYCINCDRATCRYCGISGHHSEHKLLTIYRHVYQDAVLVCEMERHINCRDIQHYKCNKKWVVSLHPLPHTGSGSLIEGDGACITCRRKLTDHSRFRFCSIACQFQAITGRTCSVQPHAQRASTSQRTEEGEQIINYRKRSRKGVHRAPFF